MDNIGIIGCGNMGRAICERINGSYSISVFDKDSEKTKGLSGVSIAKNTAELIENSDVVILAVKPQDFESLLNEIKGNIKDRLVISIAAGITTNYIEKILGDIKVIRVMPNMPAKIGEGMSCLCKGKNSGKKELNFSKELFDKLGKTLVLNEDMMDAATAISGSGPGYFYDMIENKGKDDFVKSLTAAAENIGFSHEDASLLAGTTGNGSQIFLEKTKSTPEELKKQITSKGGTTEAALKVLHSGGSLKDAVKAAEKRAKELSKE